MNADLVMGLLKIFLPIANDVIQHYTTHANTPPTKAEMRAILHKNADAEIDAWADWNAAHPRP